MPVNNHKRQVSAADDEPSPFVEDRPDFNANQQTPALIKLWPWLVAAVIAGLILVIWAQRPASTPTQTAPAETETSE